MASGTLDADKINKEKSKWGEGNKVYTRRFKRGTKNNAAPATTITASSPPPITTTTTVTAPSPPITSTAHLPSPPTAANNEQALAIVDDNSLKQQSLSRHLEVVAAVPNRVIKPVVALVDGRIKINLTDASPKNEIKEVRKKLKTELGQVRVLVEKLEDKEAQLTANSTDVGATGHAEAYSHSQYSGNDTTERRALLRVNSEMGSDYMDRRALARVNSEMGSDAIDRRALMRVSSEVGAVTNQYMRPFRQLNVSVIDNSNGVGALVEKEKRTPKANQFYRNSEFLLGKDRLPSESNKRSKANGGRKHGREADRAGGPERYRNQVMKNCSNLLQKLMKHKHGWVFNEPVNAKLLGLHDYHEIIKHPMDLGTIKSRLAQNFYKSPREFAEDIRLTFRNAMTYNPKGQDVHVMAEQLSDIFEERWAVIESEYTSDWRYGMIYGGDTPTPTIRKVPHLVHAPPRTLDRSEFMNLPFISGQKPSTFNNPVSRTPVPKKPKAKDPNKRDMTYEEKQKLSTNLQSLPSEKLDNIVQIIKKRNTTVSQHDEEIEVDIDGVDAETLWELDRFVTNYRKSLSKHKRKAELAQQAKAAGNANQTVVENSATSGQVAPKENKAGEKSLNDQGARKGDNVSRSSSSSSSSSDSGSSSSDSDSDTSSADGSDAGHSPRS